MESRICLLQMTFADIAQSVEHLIGNEEVISSNLIISSKNSEASVSEFLFFGSVGLQSLLKGCMHPKNSGIAAEMSENFTGIFKNLLTNAPIWSIICKEFATRQRLGRMISGVCEGRDKEMAEVKVKEGESLDSALRRFKRQCARSNILTDLRKREYYEKPSVKRKKKSEAARKRKYK